MEICDHGVDPKDIKPRERDWKEADTQVLEDETTALNISCEQTLKMTERKFTHISV